MKQAIDSVSAKEKFSIRGRYLDIGCDQSFPSLVLSDSFSEIVNVDINRQAVKSGKENCKSKNVDANFIIADAQRLPFKQGSFDVITSFSIIEHLDDQKHFLEGTQELLNNDGLLILQVPNRNFFIELHTGLIFPSLMPQKVWDLYCRFFLKIKEDYQIKNLTTKQALKLCKPFFKHTYIFECNYTADNIPSNFRGMYKFATKTGVLHYFPLGLLLFCSNA